jgi:hypothetical protein
MQRNKFVVVLKHENGTIIETPVVAYCNRDGNISKSVPFSIMGPYYYFDVEEKEKNDSKRVVIFLGKLYVPMNLPNEEWDRSLLKSELLREINDPDKYHRQTIRISDHDGNWTHEYDSVYLGKIELDDGRVLSQSFQWVAKSLEQITLLD